MDRLSSDTSGTVLATKGLSRLNKGQRELLINVQDQALVREGVDYVEFLINYLANDKTITAGQTVTYGYWTVRYDRNDQHEYLIASEGAEDFAEFVPGIRRTLTYFGSQRDLCLAWVSGANLFTPLHWRQCPRMFLTVGMSLESET